MMSIGKQPGHDDMPSQVREAREVYQELHGEAPPVNPAEAGNGFVRVGDGRYDQPWREYEGQKSVNLEEIGFSDLVAYSPHSFDPEEGWHDYDPGDEELGERYSEGIAEASEAFDIIMDGEVDLGYGSEETKTYQISNPGPEVTADEGMGAFDPTER